MIGRRTHYYEKGKKLKKVEKLKEKKEKRKMKTWAKQEKDWKEDWERNWETWAHSAPVSSHFFLAFFLSFTCTKWNLHHHRSSFRCVKQVGMNCSLLFDTASKQEQPISPASTSFSAAAVFLINYWPAAAAAAAVAVAADQKGWLFCLRTFMFCSLPVSCYFLYFCSVVAT